METSTKWWIGVGATVTALLVTFGIIEEAKASPSKSPSIYLHTITDVPTLKQYQSVLATAIAANGVPGMTTANYASTDVDGNSASPKWVAALAAFQVWANAVAKASGGFVNPPAGFPAQLRTDGVLDYATATVLASANP